LKMIKKNRIRKKHGMSKARAPCLDFHEKNANFRFIVKN
jgi:hypothetical protein